MDDPDAVRALAKRYFDSLETGDVDALIDCYAPDAAIWHNTSGKEITPAEHIEQLRGFTTRVLDRAYVDRRIDVFAGGFVQQHVLRGTRKADGATVAMPTCDICRVHDGRITRLDAYIDSAHVAELTRGA
jgi:ketosteroid isomerase-like protein